MSSFPSIASLGVALVLALQPMGARGHEASEEMAAAAKNFLMALPPELRDKARLEFGDADRKNWHYIPRARKGLPIKEMSQEQRLLAQALLATGLSHEGYSKAASIMSLEAVLAILESGKANGLVRDPELYYVSIFGQPGGTQPWGWRVEGHHLSLNFTVGGSGAPSLTPSFFGSNPGEVKTGPRTGTRILGTEEDLGRALVTSLSAEQQKVAVLPGAAPKDVLNDPKRVDPTKPEGIAQSALKPEQQATLAKLVREYLWSRRPDVAAEQWAKIEKAGVGNLYFAWAGETAPGKPHYYRVQGGNFVLEYDNTQNEANHVHCLWRDFDGDFGADLLKEHIDAAHKAAK